MTARSNRPDVRNPLIAQPELVSEWNELRAKHPDAAAALQRMLRRLSKTWRAQASETWERHKAPMARYQRRNADAALDLAVLAKAAGVYSRHLAAVPDHADAAKEGGTA